MEEKHELKSAIKEMKSLALRAEGAPEGEGDLQDDFVMEAMMAPEGQDDGDEVQEGLPSDAPKAEARSYQRRLGLLGVLDAQFERLALDYDDDNIGELDDGNVQSAGGQPDSALLGQVNLSLFLSLSSSRTHCLRETKAPCNTAAFSFLVMERHAGNGGFRRKVAAQARSARAGP